MSVEPVEPLEVRSPYEWDRLARGGVLILLGTLLGNALTLIFQMVAARALDPVRYGALAMGIAISFFVSLSIGSSIGTVVRRFAAPLIEASKTDGLRTVMQFSLVASIVVPSVIAIPMIVFNEEVALLFLDDTRFGVVISIFGVSLIVNTVLLYQRSVFHAFVEPGRNLVHGVVLERGVRLVGAGLVIALVTGGDQLTQLSLVYLASLLVPLAAVPLFMSHRIRGPRVDAGVSRRDLLRFMVGVLSVDAAGFALDYADIFLVGAFLGPEEVGLYNAALALGTQPTVIVSSIAALFLPAISAAFGSGNHVRAQALTSAAASRVVLLAVPVIGFLALFSRDLLEILFGSSFRRAGLVLSLLALSNLIFSLSGLFGVVLFAVRRNRALLSFVLIAFAVKALVGVVAIPLWGITGAAIANVAGIGVAAFLRARGAQVHAGIGLAYSSLLPYVGAGVLAGTIPLLARWLLPVNLLTVIASGLAFGVAYLGILLLFGIVDAAELKGLIKMTSRV